MALKSQLARPDLEQEIIVYKFWKQLFIFLQHPFFTPFLLHLLIENKTKILKLLKRIQSELKSIQITVIFGLYSSSIECINWLKEELRKEDISNSILVKSIDECRGLEFPALVTISSDTSWGSRVHDDSSVADAWTRVTSTLVVINLDGKYHIFSEGLKDALKSKVAHRAVEQEDISYSYLKQLFIFLQHPFFTPFLLPLLLFFYYINNQRVGCDHFLGRTHTYDRKLHVCVHARTFATHPL